MLRSVFIFFALLIGSLVMFNRALKDGTVLRTLDEHPQTRGVPRALYVIGQGYYLLNDLQEAATYFWRIDQRYPTYGIDENAGYYYLQCLDGLYALNKAALIERHEAYLARYPSGPYAELVARRIELYRSGGR
jgi:outer membrane protein assembly factor BamD (BamD/ComL family)